MKVKAGTPEAAHIDKVFVDGKEVKHCTYFDQENELAICLKVTATQNSMIIFEVRDDIPVTKTYRGKITYTTRDPNDS